MPFELLLCVSCVIAYLLGSFSGGMIVSGLAHGPDLHTVGSKSTGASNVQRTMGWKFGLITFFFDAVKGFLACWIADTLCGSHFAAMLAGLCCVIGHNWPVFYHFRGGKGVATTGAVLLYCYPRPAILCIALTILVIALFRYISVGSMLLVVSFFFLSFFFLSAARMTLVRPRSSASGFITSSGSMNSSGSINSSVSGCMNSSASGAGSDFERCLLG